MRPPRALLSSLLLLAFLGLSCNLPLPTQSTAGDERRLELGETQQLLTTNIGAAGGTIRIEATGSPVDGWTIEVPAGAYAGETTFRISMAPIVSHTYGEAFDPQTPLVHIDNGAAVAQGFLTLIVPLDVPSGSFPLAFTYDAESGALEGLPVVPAEGKVRIPMRTFSAISVAVVREILLQGTVTTGFSPEQDMWPFPNEGSAAATLGHCAGQSLSSLYYFQSRARGPLRQAYDPFDNPHEATPDLPEDDRLGIRLSSAAQAAVRIQPSVANPDIDWWLTVQSDDPRVTYLTLAGLMLVSEQPQLVHLQGATTAHAVVAYGAEGGQRILIADPNHPGEARQLPFQPGGSAFDGYMTGTTTSGTPIKFDHAYFLRKWDVIDRGILTALWQAFEDGTVGDDLFPTYTIWASSADPSVTTAPVPLSDGFQTSEKKLKLAFEPQGFQGRVVVYSQDGRALEEIRQDRSPIIDLPDDETTLGFHVLQTGGKKELWVDFRWMRIGRNACVAAPESYEAAYTWEREGEQRMSGSGGSGCRWEYTVTNRGDEPLVVLLRTHYETGAMNGGRWERFNLAPGGRDVYQVSRMDYTSGADTYDIVERVLVVRDVPECQALLSDESEPRWLSLASPTADFTCE